MIMDKEILKVYKRVEETAKELNMTVDEVLKELKKRMERKKYSIKYFHI